MQNHLSQTAAVLAVLFCLSAASHALTVKQEVKVNGKTCDVVTWTDANGKERTAALVRADGDVGKFKGGYVEQYTYFVGDTKKTAKSDESMAGVSGMGNAVDHHGKGASISKGASSNAKTEFVFVGDGHALWRFRSDYSGPGKENKTVSIPLAIDYFFADGRSDIGWAVSYDCSKLADGEVSWDARGPYFQFDWDGDGKFFGVKPSGIRWGDKFKFKTVKYDGDKSSWDYSEPNTIPYMALYKDAEAGDVECGVVATVPWDQKDAGGYWWSSKNWGKKGEGMMENWNCPFQLNAYEGYASEKMAWGANYGFVGMSAYDTLEWKGKRCGWPYQGYAVSIIINKYSEGLTDAMVASNEAAQQTKLTAVKGTVAAKGPMYAALTEQAEYKTPGWDSVYGIWTVACKDNEAQIDLDVTKGALLNPTICFTDFAGAAAPTVTLNGQALKAGKDCHVSVDKAGKRVFVTLSKKVEGAKNAIAVK